MFFFAFWRQTDKQTDEQMDNTDALRRSHCREQKLNKQQRYTQMLKQIGCHYILLSTIEPGLYSSYAMQASRMDQHASKCCLTEMCFKLSFHWFYEDLVVVVDL